MSKRTVIFAALMTLLCLVVPHAQQTPAPAAPAFDVASVKFNRSGEMGARIQRQPGGRLNVFNMPLRDLIQFAYQVRGFQIEGGPGWITSDRFDITAKAEGDIPPTMPGGAPAPEMLMLRTLLTERFKLQVHTETKELPIYAMTLARPDGTLGPKLTKSSTDCLALIKAASGRGGAPPPPPAAGERILCGMRIGYGRMDAGAFPISELAGAFGQLLQRTVVDRTGLTGVYDAELSFRPEQLTGPPALPGAAAPPVDADAPSIFTAVQEQLGLRLDSTRGPVQVLVIDRVEPPTED